MSVFAVSSNHPLVSNFIEKKTANMKDPGDWEDYFDMGTNWEYMKNLILSNPEQILVINVEKETVLALCIVQKSLPAKFEFVKDDVYYSPFIHVEWSSYEEQRCNAYKILSFLKETYPKILLEWSDCCSYANELGFLPIDSSFEKGSFIFNDCECGLYIWGKDNDFLSKPFFSEVMQEDNFPIDYVIKSNEELCEELRENNHFGWKIPVYLTHNNHRNFMGFRYFNPSDLTNIYCMNNGVYYVVAYNQKGNIVGTLKIGEYCHGSIIYTGICFVDVHWAYRKRGIATAMFRKLNEFLISTDIVIGSHLSDEGKEAHMDKVMKQSITVCPVYKDDEEFYNKFRASIA